MTIEIKKRDLFIFGLSLLLLWFIYLGRTILTPFILAAVFAYLLNPVIGLLHRKAKIPRAAAITIIYLILISSIIFLIFTVWSRYAEESLQFNREARNFLTAAENQLNTLPIWARPFASDLLNSGRSYLLLSPRRVVAMLPGAVNGVVSLLVFLVATFYFLKDGEKMLSSLLNLFPPNVRLEIEVTMRKVNQVLGNYLRGQLFLIAIMSVITFLALNIIGVRYSLLLSLFTGVAETVPLIGPVIAAILAMMVAYTDNFTRWGLDPVSQVVLVGLVYTVLRQIEDLFVIPQVQGRLTKLHPLVVLFAALLGGHLFGVVGFIVAVPVVAALRVVFIQALDNLYRQEKAPQDG